MSRDTLSVAAARIGEHVARHGQPEIRIVLHGGEPLLAGTAFLAEAAALIRDAVPAGTRVDCTMQTNGVLLTERVLDDLLRAGIGVGVSIDGAPEDHDRHRRFPGGRGSYASVAAGLRRLAAAPYSQLYRGLLCTIDLDNDPLRTYESLLDFGPPRVDLLLPHGNWTTPPPGRGAGADTPYADWLIPIFDRWYQDFRPGGTVVRLFEEILGLILGGPSHSETIGTSRVGLLVIETNGALEQVDTLKSAYQGAAAVGLDVFSHPFDTVLEHPAIAARQIGLDALCGTCRSCDLAAVCGAGYYPHRYRAGDGYRNPSVYCLDLMALIRHIDARVRSEVAAVRAR